MRVKLRATILLASLVLSTAAPSTPPPPPAPLTWSRSAWQCPGKERSAIEIESLAEGESGYRLRVTELKINGRDMDPATVPELAPILARRNFLRLAGGYCERSGEVIGIEELANGPKSGEAGWRRIYVPYDQNGPGS